MPVYITLGKVQKQAVDDKDHAVDFELKDNHLKTELIDMCYMYIDTFFVLNIILYAWISNKVLISQLLITTSEIHYILISN